VGLATGGVSSAFAQDETPDAATSAGGTSEPPTRSTSRTSDVPLSTFVILDPDRLFSESAFGLRVQAELNDLAREVQSENGKLTRDLEAEELDLLDQRARLSAEDFRDIADAFDEKVQIIRDAQERKAQELTARATAERQAFNVASLPVLQTILSERKALGILDSRVVFLPAAKIDITNEAILRVDQVLKDGTIE
jgi:Skp family chaperone for outer membrane proteins